MRNRINGLAGGALWLVLITTAFVTVGLFMINTPDATWALAATVAISFALTTPGLAILRSTAQPGPRARLSPDELVMFRRFSVVFGAEIVFPRLGGAPVVWAVAWCNLREANRELAAVRTAQ